MIVTDRPGLGRFAWRDTSRLRLLTVIDPADLPVAVEGVRSAGVDRWSLLTIRGPGVPDAVVGGWRVVGRHPVGSWEFLDLEAR